MGPGYWLHQVEAVLWHPFVRTLVTRLHRTEPFDLIHAHFIYPEGVIAAKLSQRLGIPAISTEQAPWDPWLRTYRRVGAQVRNALPRIARVVAVSDALRRNIRGAVPHSDVSVDVVYNVVDEQVFRAPADGERRDPDQILFVGVVRRVKGLDVLVRALVPLSERRPEIRLVVVGSAYYRGYARDEAEVRRLVQALGLAARVQWVGQVEPPEVARYMRQSAVLVVPSRRETFSAVTVEALASGTPVVATRCGGPEEIVTPENGRLVPTDDPDALAAAIDQVLSDRMAMDPARLRAQCVERFGRAAATQRLAAVYQSVLQSGW